MGSPTCHNRYDDWFHWKFAKRIKGYADIFFYTPFMHEKEPSFTPIPYDGSILLKDVVSELKIDCVILSTKSGAHHNYLPKMLYHENHGTSIYWLPSDFEKCDVLKICIEEDFQYETDYDWHKEKGFKLILQQHYVHSLRTDKDIDVRFFPFCVDTNYFFPKNTFREDRIALCGTRTTGNATSGGSVYKPRELAVDTLRSAGLLAEDSVKCSGSRKEGQNYLDYLQKYIGYISCGSIYNLTPAKMVEIMASGGVLFTNETLGLDVLFPKDTYETYNKTCSDLVEKAKKVISDKEYRDGMVKRAMECIEKKHTSEIRIKQLLKHIEDYL